MSDTFLSSRDIAMNKEKNVLLSVKQERAMGMQF